MFKNGVLIMGIEKKLERWKSYVEELYNDNRDNNFDNFEREEEMSGPKITTTEVLHAIKHMKNKKASGPDEVTVDLLKLIEEDQIKLSVELFNMIYDTGIIPEEWLLSIFIPIPKKLNAKECSEHRTISLISHTLKAFLKIIHNRLYHKLEENISETQFGFRKGLGTREALFALNVLIQRSMDVNQHVYACFVDYNKAFDKVQHDKMMQLLCEKNIDHKDIRIIANLYYKQKGAVRIEDKTTTEFEVKRGIRQGCGERTLFNLYSEEIMKNALYNVTVGIKVNGIPIHNIRYADDTVLLAENIEDLQTLLDRVVEASAEFGLTLNARNTKHMIITKKNNVNNQLYIGNQQIERVRKYSYLGTTLNDRNNYTEEISSRIERARGVFMNMKKYFSSRDISIQLKLRMLKCYVFSVLFYSMEAWSLKKEHLNKLNAFEMWLYRRILRIS